MEIPIDFKEVSGRLQIEIRSPDLEKEVNALIVSGPYPNPHAVIIDALENLVQIKKGSQFDAAIKSYQAGEITADETTIDRDAELSGMSHFEFEEVLKARGILKVVEVDSVTDWEAGVSLIKNHHTPNKRTEDQ